MRKRDALRLKPGDVVVYADHTRTEKAKAWGEGRVRRVTAAGGVSVEPIFTKNDSHDWEPERGGAAPIWVCYSHVISVYK